MVQKWNFLCFSSNRTCCICEILGKCKLLNPRYISRREMFVNKKKKFGYGCRFRDGVSGTNLNSVVLLCAEWKLQEKRVTFASIYDINI